MVEGVSLALSMRVLVNLESLNMAESVGNVTRHRKAPVVVKTGAGEYRLIYVPVISGMTLAHHYQHQLAKTAHSMGLNVTNMSLLGYFMKFSDDKIINSYYPEVKDKVSKKKSPCENEKAIVEACTVADVGGFLYTEATLKRTSRFSFTYLMPALDAVEKGAAGVYPQLHVRYTPEARKGEQALIYVDNASALYTLSFLLEASKISRLDSCPAMGMEGDLGAEERAKRFKASIEALAAMLGNMYFGAKRSRSMPHWQVESIVVVASRGVVPFIPSPGHTPDYMLDTAKRLQAQAKVAGLREYKLTYYTMTDTGKPGIGEEAGTLEEAIKAAADWALERLD